MKRYITFLLVFVMLLFTACGTAQPPTDHGGSTTSTTSTTSDVTPTDGTEPTTSTTPTVTEPPSTEPTNPSTNPTTTPTTTPTDDNSGTGGTETTTPPTTESTTPPEKPVPTPTLTLDKTSMSLTVGGQGTIKATYTGSGSITWKTSNASVATVSNGTVYAKAAGTADITVEAGGLKMTCKVTVTAPNPTLSLSISTKKDTTILVGETLQIEYSYSGDKSKLTWSVTDPSVLTVNASGVVTAVGAGSTNVKVTDGTLTARVRIIVEKPAESDVKATEVSYKGGNAPLTNGITKYAGDSMTCTVAVLPVAANRNINVTSSDNNVVSVSWKLTDNINTITLNFKSAGSATITITSADGCASKSYDISVKGNYDCNPGSGQLTPEQYCYAAMQVAKATTGATPVSNHSYYRVMTIDSSKLVWSNARDLGRSLAHEFYDNSSRICITFVEVNANGQYVFHIGY